MAKKKESGTDLTRKIRPALTPEAEENQCIHLAMQRAKEQLMDGTASSQVIVHFLKLGSSKEKIEKEILERQKELITAKTDQIHSTKQTGDLYADAARALSTYQGQSDDADNIKYASLRAAEEFGLTIEAYMYPDEFAVCDGSVEVGPGVYIGQQKRVPFGLAYRTKIGSDTDSDKGYKLHLVYNATVSPSETAYETVNDSPDAITMSWEAKR